LGALVAISYTSPTYAQDTTEADTGSGELAEEPVDAASDEAVGEFVFGSYGRAQFEFDGEGNAGSSQNIVSHGPRLFQEDYAEFDFSYTLEKPDGLTSQVLFTLALFGPFAHYDGDFVDQPIAVRNLYVRMANFSEALDGLSLWAGSRMYRGDDIYLLDWWPLDELNTVGGGVAYRQAGFDARLHVGVNRLDNAYQFQAIEVPAQPFGARPKVLLDRQRLLSSARLEYAQPDLIGRLGAKAVLYSEYHRLPEGERVPPEFIQDGAPTQPEEDLLVDLPSDDGFVLGTEIGLFESETSNHLNLFFRWSRGLAAYGEFGVPFGVATDGTAQGADEVLGALSGNWESRWVGVMAGAYLRRFEDADINVVDTDEFVEGAAVVRPSVFVTDHFHQAFELSYQRRYPFGLDPDTGQHEDPQVVQLSVLELLSIGRGNYDRPQIRLGYTVAFANDAAREEYPEGDERRPEAVEHIFSVGAEWWFNSSTY
jgi:maltoporin